MSADEDLQKAAETFRERRPLYKDNYIRVGQAMQAMFPEGLELKTVDDHVRYHIFSWIMGKFSRYAVQFDKGGHADSAHDLIVYAAILASYDKEIKSKKSSFAKVAEAHENILKSDKIYTSKELQNLGEKFAKNGCFIAIVPPHLEDYFVKKQIPFILREQTQTTGKNELRGG